MKILFLDIDGVLNNDTLFRSFEHAAARHAAINEPDRELFDFQHMVAMVDPELVANLNKVIEATGAKVCLSSSWRTHLTIEQMMEILVGKGFVGEIIDRTPDKRMSQVRGQEIDDWLEGTDCEVDVFVIVDDNADMYPHMDRLVQTLMADGLTEEKANAIIAMMNG